jgi:hypothetical protein
MKETRPMLYSIIRLLKDGKIDVQMVTGEELNSELQCYEFQDVAVHSNLMIFFMADHDASGHNYEKYDYQNNCFNNAYLYDLIKKQHRTADQSEVYEIMCVEHHVPFVLLPYILHEIKNSMGDLI